jgi:hypothetical protein
MIIPPATIKVKRFSPTLSEFLTAISSRGPSVIPLSAKQEPIRLVFKGTEPEAEMIAEVVGGREVGEVLDATTDHAWLVVLGHFAQALGVVRELLKVPLAQRQGPDEVAPQTKLLEFLVGILGGIETLQELNQGAQPIASDPTVAAAWGQSLFRHYSQVSRSLEAADEQTLAGVIEVLRLVSAPYIQAAVMETIKQRGQLTLDVDLTGREVSPTSTDYPEADFGWMDDQVRKGYQAAITSLVCERWGRLLLTLQRYPGRTLSAACLQAAVKEVEEVLQVRPRRRVELVQGRRQELVVQMNYLHDKLAENQRDQQRQWADLRSLRQEIKQLQAEVSQLQATYQANAWTERPHSQLAKRRHALASAQKRASRAWRDLEKGQAQAASWQQRLNHLQDQLLTLDEWLAYLEADNSANPNPVTMVVRIDAGFSTGANLTWLIEMGYTVLTKTHHSHSTDRLRRRRPARPAGTPVGKNAEAMAMGAYHQNECPYPLQAMLVRYHLPTKTRYTSLLYYGETPPPALPDWFKLYNARQTLEAGIKQEKGVFTLKRHLVRSPIGMPLQEQFALFGANFVRWAAAWVKDLLSQANQNFKTALGQVKTLVRIVSHTRARWVRNAVGNTLIFDETSPFAGTVIRLSGWVAVQLPLRLFNFAPS